MQISNMKSRNRRGISRVIGDKVSAINHISIVRARGQAYDGTWHRVVGGSTLDRLCRRGMCSAAGKSCA